MIEMEHTLIYSHSSASIASTSHTILDGAESLLYTHKHKNGHEKLRQTGVAMGQGTIQDRSTLTNEARQRTEDPTIPNGQMDHTQAV